MLLRRTLEQCLPLKEGEEHLSPRARELVFRGSYFRPKPIYSTIQFTHGENTAHPTYSLFVRRKGESWSNLTAPNSGYLWDEPVQDVVLEMSAPGKLARARRIESFGRKVKLSLLGGVAISLAAYSLLTPANGEPASPPERRVVDLPIDQCSEVLSPGTYSGTLIDPENAGTLQPQDGQLCAAEGQIYLIKPQLSEESQQS